MGKYDEQADAAMASTKEKLKEELSDLVDGDIASLFPNTADKEVIDKLIADAQKIVDRNERIAKYKEAGLKLSVEGAKMFKTACKAIS
jgi:ferredoxin-fold anticodon binding domain-containing protein